jgi:hypothetical protein
MAKGQQRTPKEKKKAKAEDGKTKQVSAYKASLSGGGSPTVSPLSKK